MAEVRDQFGLKIVTEALDERGVDLVEKYGDMIQIGARNMQNFSLLRRARAVQAAGPFETRHGRHAGGMVTRGGIHHVGRQLSGRFM